MLTFQYVPYNEIDGLSPAARIDKLLSIVKRNKIVLMQGRLQPAEEAKLIERTMQMVSREFKGIELCTIASESRRYSNSNITKQLKNVFFKAIAGNREGFTIVGPASIIKEIKRNPDRIELFTKDIRKR
ncbi:DUF2073 domain-containing protein [archaeon]|nr:DUF2073 domain-containing protein [archaeon]